MKLVLTLIAAISKGQQQASHDTQQQRNNLFTPTNKPRSNVIIEQQKIQEKPATNTFQPITFPSNDEDEITSRFQLSPSQSNSLNQLNQLNQPSHSANLILQSVDQKLPTPISDIELERPTRVAVATSHVIANRYTDDQFDYVRDFAWNMFQGSKIPSPIGNLVLCPIQPQIQLSLLRNAAADLTEEEIAQAIREVNPGITRDLINHLKLSNSLSTNLGVTSALFAKKNLQYVL